MDSFTFDEKNDKLLDPFQANDQNILQFREEEEKRRFKARRDNQRLKIWDKKSTSGLENEQYYGRNKSRTEWIKSLVQGDEDYEAKKIKEITGIEVKSPKKNSKQAIMESIETYLSDKGIKEKKESLPDFIAKKKELFLLQMSLNIKREEVEKLKNKAKLIEETIDKNEKILEEDALRFDLFLKENDKKAQEACREAEKETKRKMQKIQEIKKLNQQLQVVQSTINKHKDNLDECTQYKLFLDRLTPRSWVEQQLEVKRERQQKRRRDRIQKRQQEWKVQQKEKMVQEQKARQEKIEYERMNRKSKHRTRRKQNKDLDTGIMNLELPSTPDFDDEPLTSSDEDIPMYFNQPYQIAQIFSNMEEENLFLIQNAHEAEQSLDEMSSRFQEKKEGVQEKVDNMQEKINGLKRSIILKQQDIQVTKNHLEGKNGVSKRQDEESVQTLSKKVKEVYLQCGFNDAGSTPRTLFMLSEIEACMEGILSRIKSMPDDDFIKADKLKEKKRRESKRAQQQAEQARVQEERNRKVIERSMNPPKKPKGKKV